MKNSFADIKELRQETGMNFSYADADKLSGKYTGWVEVGGVKYDVLKEKTGKSYLIEKDKSANMKVSKEYTVNLNSQNKHGTYPYGRYQKKPESLLEKSLSKKDTYREKQGTDPWLIPGERLTHELGKWLVEKGIAKEDTYKEKPGMGSLLVPGDRLTHEFGKWLVEKGVSKKDTYKERTGIIPGNNLTHLIPGDRLTHEFGKWLVEKGVSKKDTYKERTGIIPGNNLTHLIPGDRLTHEFGKWLVEKGIAKEDTYKEKPGQHPIYEPLDRVFHEMGKAVKEFLSNRQDYTKQISSNVSKLAEQTGKKVSFDRSGEVNGKYLGWVSVGKKRFSAIEQKDPSKGIKLVPHDHSKSFRMQVGKNYKITQKDQQDLSKNRILDVRSLQSGVSNQNNISFSRGR